MTRRELFEVLAGAMSAGFAVPALAKLDPAQLEQPPRFDPLIPWTPAKLLQLHLNFKNTWSEPNFFETYRQILYRSCSGSMLIAGIHRIWLEDVLECRFPLSPDSMLILLCAPGAATIAMGGGRNTTEVDFEVLFEPREPTRRLAFSID